MSKEIAKIKTTEELVREIAMDIGKDVVSYVEWQYPKAIERTSSTFKLSLRNCIYNQIMASLEVTDEVAIVRRLEERKKFRRQFKKIFMANRKVKP